MSIARDERDPFGVTADPSSYVPRLATERALVALERAVISGKGPVVLTGPAGLGKTLLLRVLAERIGERLRTVYLPYAALPPEELSAWTLGLLGESPESDPESELVALAERLRAVGTGLLLLLDDAGSMPPATARGIAELAAESHGGLRILAAAVDDANSGRVIAALGPATEEVRLAAGMDPRETALYLRARLERAGVPEDQRARFDADLVERITRASGGVPRVVQQLAAEVLWRGDDAEHGAPWALSSEPLIEARDAPGAGRLRDARVAGLLGPRRVEPETDGAIWKALSGPGAAAPPGEAAAPEIASAAAAASASADFDPIRDLRPSGAPPRAASGASTEPTAAVPDAEIAAPIAARAETPAETPRAIPAEASPAPAPRTESVPPARPLGALDTLDPRHDEVLDRIVARVTRSVARPAAPESPAEARETETTAPAMSVADSIAAAIDQLPPALPEPASAAPAAISTVAAPPATERPGGGARDASASIPSWERTAPPEQTPHARARSEASRRRSGRRGLLAFAIGAALAAAALIALQMRLRQPPAAPTPPSDAATVQPARPAPPPPVDSPAPANDSAVANAPPDTAAAPDVSAAGTAASDAAVPADATAHAPAPAAPTLPPPAPTNALRTPAADAPLARDAAPPAPGPASVESGPPPAPPSVSSPPAPFGTAPADTGAAPAPPAVSAAPPIPVHVNATPWATIEVDGRPLGETPLAGVPLAPGEHRFRAKFPGGRVIERRVVIDAKSRYVTFP